MTDIEIHVFHTGEVCVAPDIPFGGDNSIIDQDFCSGALLPF